MRAKSRRAEPLSRVALTTRGESVIQSLLLHIITFTCTYIVRDIVIHLADYSISGRVYGILTMLCLSGALI